MERFDWEAWFEFVDPISKELVAVPGRKLSADEAGEIQGRISKALARDLSLKLPSDFQVSCDVFAQFISITPVADGLPCSFQFSKGEDGECASIAVYRNAERLEFFVTGDSVELGWALTSTEGSYGIRGTVCCTDPADRASMLRKLLAMLGD
jgi:hypothetical protein